MTKMNSTHSSKLSVALLTVAVLLAATGTAAAFAVSAQGLPVQAEVGTEVSVTYTINDPFTGVPNQWTLQGTTELQNVVWTVTVLRAGEPVEGGETTYGNQSFNRSLDVANNGDEIRIELTGTTPAIENYTYRPREQFVIASLSRRTGNNTQEFRNDTVHHFTAESQRARQAIDDANATVSAVDDREAEQLLSSAKSAYNAGNFENAVNLSQQASDRAESVQQSRQTTQLLLYGAGAIVILAVIAGAIYYWRSQQDEYRAL
ncbi:MAG: hypothetical protein ABEH35_03445 [Haloarculaceae archaeon]